MVTRESRDDERLRLGSRKLPAAQNQQERHNFSISDSGRQPLSARISSQDVGMRSSDATLVGSHRNKSRQSSLAPRASALLRAVQRGDYGGLAKLLESSNNRCSIGIHGKNLVCTCLYSPALVLITVPGLFLLIDATK